MLSHKFDFWRKWNTIVYDALEKVGACTWNKVFLSVVSAVF